MAFKESQIFAVTENKYNIVSKKKKRNETLINGDIALSSFECHSVNIRNTLRVKNSIILMKLFYFLGQESHDHCCVQEWLFKWIHLLNRAESHALVATENVTKTRAAFEQFLLIFLSNLFLSELFLKV